MIVEGKQASCKEESSQSSKTPLPHAVSPSSNKTPRHFTDLLLSIFWSSIHTSTFSNSCALMLSTQEHQLGFLCIQLQFVCLHPPSHALSRSFTKPFSNQIKGLIHPCYTNVCILYATMIICTKEISQLGRGGKGII